MQFDLGFVFAAQVEIGRNGLERAHGPIEHVAIHRKADFLDLPGLNFLAEVVRRRHGSRDRAWPG